MDRPSRLLFCLALLVCGLVARAEDTSAPAMKLLKENCFACHNPEKKKGGLVLTTRDLAMKGNEDGPVILPGNSAKSPLAQALLPDADPHMPPKRQLTDPEIALVRRWIDAGAPWNDKALAAAAPTTQPVVLRPLPASYHPILALALSPDQTHLAVARGDRILLYNLTAKNPPGPSELSTPREPAYSLAFSHDGKLLAIGGYRVIHLLNLANQTCIDLQGLPGRANCLAFTPDDHTLLAGGGEEAISGIIARWRIPDGKLLCTFPAHTDVVLALALSPDAQRLFTASADKLVKMWDLPHRQELARFEGHVAQVGALALNPSATLLASAGEDREVKVWDLKTRTQAWSLMAHSAEVTSLTWLDDKRMASTCQDGNLRLLTENSKERPDRLLEGAPDVLYSLAVTKDAKRAFAGSHDGNVYVYSLSSGKLEHSLPLDVPSIQTTQPLSFRQDILPALSRAGCNAGACHAKPKGQNGFSLSVFAYDPKADYRAIVKDVHGRRVFPAAPQESLILKKPTMALSHGGGLRFKKDSPTYNLLVQWIEQGMPYARDGEGDLVAIDISPAQKRYAKRVKEHLIVRAHYSDGSTRDVTALADFSSTEKGVARVDDSGLLTIGQESGEAAIIARFMGQVAVARVTVPADHLLPEAYYATLPANNFIDPLVYSRLQELGFAPSSPCTDAEFLRRASLDAIGKLPTADQAKAFLEDKDPNKREKLVDQLLADPAYGDFWASKWADLLRPNPFRVGVKSVYVLDQWLRQSFRENKPYDQFARDILLAQGSTHRYGPAVIYRDRREPTDISTLVSQVFMGVRLECARCHHHPNEKWSQEDFYQLAAYFASVHHKGQGISAPISGEAEFIFFSPGGKVRHPITGITQKPKAPDAPLEAIPTDRDPREALADWLTKKDNPFFARAAVNRVWGELMGRGIVHPVDDFRISNPAVNQPLLDALARDFADHNYDLKHLIRTIMLSRTYQESSEPSAQNMADTRYFSRSYRRRPAAEVLLDAVSDVTGVAENLQGLPASSRAIQAWNYRIDSDFLDAFARPNLNADPPCERETQGSVIQALHMMNSNKLTEKITNPAGRADVLAKSTKTPQEIVTELYLSAYSRYPTDEELKIATAAFSVPGATRKTATEDILWALLNSAEFVLNH